MVDWPAKRWFDAWKVINVGQPDIGWFFHFIFLDHVVMRTFMVCLGNFIQKLRKFKIQGGTYSVKSCLLRGEGLVLYFRRFSRSIYEFTNNLKLCPPPPMAGYQWGTVLSFGELSSLYKPVIKLSLIGSRRRDLISSRLWQMSNPSSSFYLFLHSICHIW